MCVLHRSQAVMRRWEGGSSESVRATVTKYHRPGVWSSRNTLSHSPGHGESKREVPPGLVSGETSLTGLSTASLPPGPHMAFPLCVHGERPDTSSSS